MECVRCIHWAVFGCVRAVATFIAHAEWAKCPLGNPGFGDLGAERQLCPLWSKSHEKWFFERFSLRYLGDVAVPKSCDEFFFLPNDPLPERFVQPKKSAAQPTAVHGLRPGVVDQSRRVSIIDPPFHQH